MCAGRNLLLACKHDADGTGAGIAADGGADVGLVNILKIAVLPQSGLDGSMQPGFAWVEEMNTMLRSMSSRFASWSVIYLPTQMGRLPRYFRTTFSSPSMTARLGLMPRMLAPKASTPEQRPLLAM